ncbi:hypothetical protein KJ940_06715, partial [Myxococcota bacterium]|nr:hypothetical protein [Myxococcota bacterium]
MSLTPLPQATLDQLAHGEGLLVLGPGFGPPELSLDALLARLAEVAPQLEDAALDLSGLEGLSRAERLEISAQALGRARLSAALAALLPTEAALRARLEPHHAALLGLPFSVILDVNLHALARAALYALPWPPRPISEVESGLGPPGPRLVRPRGDLFTEIGALTRREESAWVADHAALVATLRRAALRGCVFYGFEPRDPALRWIYEELLEAPAGIVLAARCEGLWRASWATRGLRFFSGPLDALAAQLIEGVAQHRPPPDLIARLALGADALRDEVAAALATLPEAQLGQSAEQARRALSLYLGLARRRLPLPTAPLAALAARCARLGARR